MSLSSLQVLANKRGELLLAEVAGLLHDWQKCIDMAVASQWRKNPAIASNKASNKIQEWQQRGQSLKPGEFAQSLSALTLSFDNASIDLKTLCEEGKDPSSAKKHSHRLVQVLGECHGLAHVDKELGEQEQIDQACDRISTAFGFEPIEPTGLLEPLLSKVKPELDKLSNASISRQDLLNAIQEVFKSAWGDTRRPINEVTLWDWGYSVAALYKSALARALLGVQPDPGNLRWRLLRVNFDVLGLYAKAVKIADLLAYQNAVSEACKRVKQLVEEEYPLGNEIYRDSTGIYFTFPDLDLPADLAQEIRRRVEEVEPELAPRIAVTVGHGQTAAEQLKGILAKARRDALEALKQPFDSENLNACWEQLWKNLPSEHKWEICPVCRLRPKEEHDEVCLHCAQRRESRLETWKQQPERTIWVGEIADHNDRVALLVGKFGLDDWLSGDLVQTLLVKAEPNNPNGCVPKNPSPARLRRVWETCQRFWEETVCNAILSQNSGANARRKRIVPNRDDWQEGLYNGKVNGKPIDLFWQPDEKAFLTISNLQAAGAFQPGDMVLLERPETKRKAEFRIQDIQDARSPFDHYRPFLPLHTSPDQFLAIVPAAAALKIVEKIRDEYEKQFGKVRNRLPIFVGLIYAERKMPLLAMMDAARQMLEAPMPKEEWKIARDVANGCVQFQNGICWNVPTVMGDGITSDEWYPYYFVVQVDPARHLRRFQLRGEGDSDPQKVGAVSQRYADRWLVHVNDLQPGDVVSITPSRFDFLWLDTAARRFEAAYDEQGRRPARPTRPFYLEDLGRLENVWETFSQRLTLTQIHQVLATIETARERWFGADEGRQSAADPAFRQFVADTLANAEWDWKKIPNKEALIAAAAHGELADWAELHLEILKEKKE